MDGAIYRGAGEASGLALLLRAAFFSALGLSIGYCIGRSHGHHAEKVTAIEAGAARWTVDAVTGERAFVYHGAK